MYSQALHQTMLSSAYLHDPKSRRPTLLQCRADDHKAGGIQQPWYPIHNTSVRLSKEQPLNDGNPVHMLLTKGNNTDSSCGIVNRGFAGVPVRKGSSYALSVYLRSHSVSTLLGHHPDIAAMLSLPVMFCWS